MTNLKVFLGTVLISYSAQVLADECKLIKAFHGQQDKIKSIMQNMPKSYLHKKVSIDTENLIITETKQDISQAQCVSEGRTECQISQETKEGGVVTSKKVSIYANEKLIKVYTCDGFKEFDSSELEVSKENSKTKSSPYTKDDLIKHITKNCGLVDRQMAEDGISGQVQEKIDLVYNTCVGPVVKDIIRGCSVPCLANSPRSNGYHDYDKSNLDLSGSKSNTAN